MEVIQIDLAVGLEFVDKVEEAEGERSARAVPSGGEPTCAEQLDTGRGWKTVRSTAFTVRKVDGMDASDVEHSEGNWGGGDIASTAVSVTEVEDSTEVPQ